MTKPKTEWSHHQVVDGEWYPVGWRGDREGCCDCGLVHDLSYRIRVKGGRRFLECRVYRNEVATAASRRGRKRR